MKRFQKGKVIANKSALVGITDDDKNATSIHPAPLRSTLNRRAAAMEQN